MHDIPHRLHDVSRLFRCKHSRVSKKKNKYFAGVNKNVMMSQNQRVMLRQLDLCKARIQIKGSFFFIWH